MNTSESYQKARELMNEGQLEEAAALFQQNIQVNPHFNDLELLGECLMLLGRSVEAIVPLTAAATLNT